jgi:hypothetical protein
VSFTFPTNVTLPPHGLVLVVNFDPGTNPQALTRFRGVFAIPDGVPLFGPYEGSLPNGEGRLELARPDIPQLPPAADAGFVPYLLVDRVNYRDEGAWTPLADGTGRSIQRVRYDAPGNNPFAWVAAAPSPGVPVPINIDSDGDGIADRWEAMHCLNPNDTLDGDADRDLDGATNREEFVAQTDPWDPDDVLRWTHAAVTPGKADFRFTAKSGVAYTVEVSEDSATGSWQLLEAVPAGSSTRTVEITDAGTLSDGRFYRVRVMP